LNAADDALFLLAARAFALRADDTFEGEDDVEVTPVIHDFCFPPAKVLAVLFEDSISLWARIAGGTP
jgi:hypothetical protein